MKTSKFLIASVLPIIFLGACAHSPMSASKTDSSPTDWSASSIDIHYSLGHGSRELAIEADDQGAHGKSVVDGVQLKQCKINAQQYQEFLTKVRGFVEPRRVPSAETPHCRAPYLITLKNLKETKEIIEVKGCRTTDEGAFSHLVQEGEFLIYRQK